MNRYLRISLLVVALAVVVWSGCTDRGTNVPPEPVITQIGGGWFTGHVFENALAFQLKNPTNQLFMDVYIPEVAVDGFDGTPGQPVPAVILLSPSGGDAFFYSNHGLIETMTEFHLP